VPTESDWSLARIEMADLHRLATLAADAEAELFRRNPQGSGRYAGRLLGRALCQGAALHYVSEPFPSSFGLVMQGEDGLDDAGEAGW